MIHPKIAITRGLSPAFEQSLKQNVPSSPIDVKLAQQQHQAYVDAIHELVPTVIFLEGDENHPDSNFVEDTGIVVGNTAVKSFMGAASRRGEEIPVAETFRNLGLEMYEIHSPGTMDGGDILFTGRDIFVGLSKRTNADALRQIENIFEGKYPVHKIPVSEGLHLKSLISFFDSETLVLAGTSAGLALKKEIDMRSHYNFVIVPDTVASNVLRLGSTLLIQDGFPESENILRKLAEQHNLTVRALNMSELIKADGALTCGSILVYH